MSKVGSGWRLISVKKTKKGLRTVSEVGACEVKISPKMRLYNWQCAHLAEAHHERRDLAVGGNKFSTW